jgi:hypothetical protein
MPLKTDSSAAPRPFAGRGAPSARPTRSADVEALQDGAENETFSKAEVLDLLKKSSADNYRQMQSLVDQLDHRQSTRMKATMGPVNSTLERLAKMGVKVDDETADNIRSQARLEALAADGGAEDDVDGNGRQVETNGRTSEANRGNGEPNLGNLIVQMMQQRGVFVLDTDPEAKLINVNEQDPQRLLQMASDAITAKVNRLAGVSSGADVSEDQTETETVIEPAGPGPNPKGKGSKGAKILAEGEPMDYLQAGYGESPEYPHAAK